MVKIKIPKLLHPSVHGKTFYPDSGAGPETDPDPGKPGPYLGKSGQRGERVVKRADRLAEVNAPEQAAQQARHSYSLQLHPSYFCSSIRLHGSVPTYQLTKRCYDIFKI